MSNNVKLIVAGVKNRMDGAAESVESVLECTTTPRTEFVTAPNHSADMSPRSRKKGSAETIISPDNSELKAQIGYMEHEAGMLPVSQFATNAARWHAWMV